MYRPVHQNRLNFKINNHYKIQAKIERGAWKLERMAMTLMVMNF